jgi:hypothetical protein
VREKRGIHRFDAMAMTSQTSGGVKIINCRYTSNYIRLQRRNAYRCPMLVRVDVRKKVEKGTVTRDWESYHTLDISESGMRLRLPASYSQGDLIEAILYINQYGIDLEPAAPDGNAGPRKFHPQSPGRGDVRR